MNKKVKAVSVWQPQRADFKNTGPMAGGSLGRMVPNKRFHLGIELISGIAVRAQRQNYPNDRFLQKNLKEASPQTWKKHMAREFMQVHQRFIEELIFSRQIIATELRLGSRRATVTVF